MQPEWRLLKTSVKYELILDAMDNGNRNITYVIGNKIRAKGYNVKAHQILQTLRRMRREGLVACVGKGGCGYEFSKRPQDLTTDHEAPLNKQSRS